MAYLSSVPILGSFISTLSTFQGPLTLLLVIFGPSLLPRLISFFRRPPQRSQAQASHPTSNRTSGVRTPPTSLTIKLFIAVHTLWLLSHLVQPPYDLFGQHRLPILASNHHLRQALLSLTSAHHPLGDSNPEGAGGNTLNAVESLHPLLELLLTKLKILDNRYLYARYGHETLTQCLWCTTPEDYLIFSLPSIGGWYLLELVFVGLLGMSWLAGNPGPSNGNDTGTRAGAEAGSTTGSTHGNAAGGRAERWRSTFAWGLICAAMVELAVKYTWTLRVIDGDCLHLASTIHTIRTIFFMLLPPIYLYLPVPPPVHSPNTLLPSISNITSTLRLTSLARKGIQRSPRLREGWSRIGKVESERMEMSKRDESVRNAVKELEVDEGMVREGARGWIREGWNGMVRIDNDTGVGQTQST